MLNMDFDQRVVIRTSEQEWLPSPASGVARKPLAREDAESGHATSIVRYEPGASFSRHEHPLGEEILVLEGVFSDETGDYPEGTWIRSPHLSEHHPFVDQETVIWVKTGHLPFQRSFS
ncbi:cupin domain-containing protein [Marinobacter salexigens]|uniref:Cupin domain-containing protein n=1 Tax=Marinobacter salexigens TaxID=1925763 RepID=A0ABS6A772_9GAMM|nr:cupin domain-containing protein [Marinobacter salexigens]MBU2873943.1 cupin domain-containing protein [Marinobacter salexigens]